MVGRSGTVCLKLNRFTQLRGPCRVDGTAKKSRLIAVETRVRDADLTIVGMHIDRAARAPRAIFFESGVVDRQKAASCTAESAMTGRSRFAMDTSPPATGTRADRDF